MKALPIVLIVPRPDGTTVMLPVPWTSPDVVWAWLHILRTGKVFSGTEEAEAAARIEQEGFRLREGRSSLSKIGLARKTSAREDEPA